ncbi:MAG: sodium:calcium antiporter [bacterium]
MVTFHIFYIALSLFLLWKGSEWLVESSVKIANSLGVSQLIIGLTVVAVGTSAPEFVVTIGAAIKGQSNISISNVIGSNIFNLGFILGGIAIVRSIQSSKELIWRDGMVLICATIGVLIFLWDLQFTRIEGLILLIGLVCYNLFLILRKKKIDVEVHLSRLKLFDGFILIFSIGLVILGGYFLREGAVGIARTIGISEWVIGATVVAAGTSAPEFAASLVASLKGQHGISIGNIIGSCIYNYLGVLGLAGLLRPMRVSVNVQSSILMLIGLVILVLIMLRTGRMLSRKEGILLLAVSIVIWIIEFI